MPYEIPTELQYQEKIVFGLTFPQLAWALLFGVPSLYLMLQSPFSWAFKITFVTLLSGLAVCFMFLDALSWIKNLIVWWRWREIDADNPLMQALFPISKIEDNRIITDQENRQKSVAILKVAPLNFAIKNEEGQQAVIKGFARFLNALDFPIQIVIGTDLIELDTYLEGIADYSKPFRKHFKDYKTFLNSIVSPQSVKNRTFFLVIPERLGSNLDIQVSICRDLLASMDLTSERLADKEIEPMLDTVVSWPKKITNHMDMLETDRTHSRILYVHGYPRNVEPGFLDRIITLPGDFDISLHVEPYPVEHMMVMLNRELQKQKADLFSADRKGIHLPSLQIQHSDTLGVLHSLQKGHEKLFHISLYIRVKAPTREEMDRLTASLEAELNALLILPRQATFRMAQGLQSCLPIGMNALAQKRSITTNPLSAFFPFTSRFLQVDELGVWFGLNKTKVPIIRDIFSLSNPNGLILASSGAGKSFAAKLLIMRQLLTGVRTLVIDPQGEYSPLVESFRGQLVTLSRTSDTIINPLDLMGHPYPEKRLALMDLMPLMLGELSEAQKAAIDGALTKVYKSKGITNKEETWENSPPILGDLLERLEKEMRRANVIEKATYRSLCNRLSMYVTGVFSFLNTHTKIDFDNQFVCFNIGEMPRQVKPVLMFMILDFCYLKMKKENQERKLLVVDEAWSLLARAAEASYLFEIVKTCRKFNLGLLLITQDVADLIRSRAGNAVLSNSAYTILLRQKPAVIDEIVDTFHLSPTEKDRLLTAQRGEGLLLMENEHTELQVVASESEKELIELTDDPKKADLGKRVGDVELDLDVPLYRTSRLRKEEVEFLLRHGYERHTMVDIDSPGPKSWLIKSSRHESPEHLFLVHRIGDYLRTQTDKVNLYRTRGPDVVFHARDGRVIALEIESGSWLKSDKEGFKEKVAQLNDHYGDNWAFVVTSSDLQQRYQKFGKCFTRSSIKSFLALNFR